MRKPLLVMAIASLLLALVIFSFGGGARAIYSGSFFIVLALVFLVNARRTPGKTPW